VTKPKGYLQINHAWKNKRMKKKKAKTGIKRRERWLFHKSV
jgi:hypothetical protein